jgi:hypothetical protein
MASYEKLRVGVVLPPPFPRVSELIVVVAVMLTVVEVSMVTSSAEPGSTSPTQLASSPQVAVPAPPSHEILAAFAGRVTKKLRINIPQIINH